MIHSTTLDTSAQTRRTRLSSMTLWRVDGKDAVRFLHGQFTNRIEGLGDHVVTAGYCSPKGRLLMVLRAWMAKDGAVMLLLPRSGSEAFVKRMRMYVLRNDVHFTDVTDAFELTCVFGMADAPEAGLAKTSEDTLMLGLQPAADVPGFVSGGSRTLVVRPKQSAVQEEISDDALWHAGEIAAGVAQVFEPTREAFVPQAVNLELVQGVVFNKGCYPGQEVVSRLQHMGETPRRGMIAVLDAAKAPAPGTVFEDETVVVDAVSNGTASLAFLCAKTSAPTARGRTHVELPYRIRNVLKD